MKKSFILGAGFSYEIAKAPLMKGLWNDEMKSYQNGLWDAFEKVYKLEKEKNNSKKSNRMIWFELLNKFIDSIENQSKKILGLNSEYICAGVKENLEYLITLIDIHTEYGARFEFNKLDVDVNPYPVIPLINTNEFNLSELRSIISTFLFVVLQNLKEDNEKLLDFLKIVNDDDEFINFNYDLVLEKGLWEKGIWSPLHGYIGVEKFENEDDFYDLDKYNRYSTIKIHKMHGSIMFSCDLLLEDNNIAINLENRENCGFFFEGLSDILSRKPIKFPNDEGYKGKYCSNWILPSFVKPLSNKTYLHIWKSALRVINNSTEIHIIGYSFRPEDTNGRLLLLNLPKECRIIVVDVNKDVKNRVEDLVGYEVYKYYDSFEKYIKDYI